MRRFVHWITALALDAPIVGVVWFIQFARLEDVDPTLAAAILLFAAIWLVYLADRVIDARRMDPQTPAAHRHQFAKDYVKVLVPAAILAGVGGLYFVPDLSRPVLHGGIALAAVCALYLGLIALARRHKRLMILKEPVVAAIFAAGASLPLWAYPDQRSPQFWLFVFLFAVLCFYNLVLISWWEAPLDRAQGVESVGTDTGRMRRTLLFVRTLLFCAVVVTAVMADFETTLAVALSALALHLLERHRERIDRETRRLLADVALMLPAILWLFW